MAQNITIGELQEYLLEALENGATLGTEVRVAVPPSRPFEHTLNGWAHVNGKLYFASHQDRYLDGEAKDELDY